MRERSLMALFVLLIGCTVHVAGQSTANRGSSSESSELQELRVSGQKAADAIANGSVSILLSLVDDDGITVGMDSDAMSSRVFMKQMNRRTGVYCVVFGCAGTQESLRSWLKNGVPEVTVHLSPDFPKTGQVDVFAKKPPAKGDPEGSPLFTIFFIHRKTGWRMQNIEYP